MSFTIQEIITLSPRLTCFSVEPRIAALGVWTSSQYEMVRTPVDVAAWHWYSPWSSGSTPLIWRVQADLYLE